MTETLLSILAGLFMWAVFIFNRLVRDRNRVLAAWSDIDVQLKRRYDLIPKLVEAVRRYAQYEQATITAVTELRTRGAATGSAGERGHIEAGIGSGIRRLLVLAEDYPDLKASDGFISLQHDLTAVESDIQFARRYYNGAVRNLNVRIESFPDLFVARAFGYRRAEFFELDDQAQREPPPGIAA